MPNYHVIKKDDHWIAKKEGATKAGGVANTQKEAEKLAKKFCANQGGGEVKIHSPKGRICNSDTVASGNDPCPPKDKKH